MAQKESEIVKSVNNVDYSRINSPIIPEHPWILPADFLNRRWVRFFRKWLGPIHPALVIISLSFSILLLLGIFSFFIQNILLNPILLFFCLLALIGGFIGYFIGPEFKVPIISSSVTDVKKKFRRMENIQSILFIVSAFPLLIFGALLFGYSGFFSILTFYALGILSSVSYSALMVRIFICNNCVKKPTIFRKSDKRWTCTVCGMPK